MSEISQHLAVLLNQRGQPLWAGYVNMLKALESLFQSPKHWILEFLQNADDAGANKMRVIASDGSIQVLNDGDVFDSSGFKAICDVNSNKAPALGLRGYIGIGFKSIYRVADKVEIHSGPYHFAFEKAYWDEGKREGLLYSKWPWEILPLDAVPVVPEASFKTCFVVPKHAITSKDAYEDMVAYLVNDNFPKEIVLLVEHVNTLQIVTDKNAFVITKKPKGPSVEFDLGPRKICQDVTTVTKVTGEAVVAESDYLIFRTTVSVPQWVRDDPETERVRRSDVKERDIGLVFFLGEGKIVPLAGKLSGVYSFLPIEGEQTGLPFGIFGDFIPTPGRDMINYSAKWNQWLCQELCSLFIDLLASKIALNEDWADFPSQAYDMLSKGYVGNKEAEEFWGRYLREPLKQSLEKASAYPDSTGKLRTLGELVAPSDGLLQALGQHLLEELTGKNLAHTVIKKFIQGRVYSPDVFEFIHSKPALEKIKERKDILVKLYEGLKEISDYYLRGKGSDVQAKHTEFVLDDKGNYTYPDSVAVVKVESSSIPSFLKAVVAKYARFLDSEIAKSDEAIRQLARCGVNVVDSANLLQTVEEYVHAANSPQAVPPGWYYPDDLIRATLYLISHKSSWFQSLVAQDGSVRPASSLFIARGKKNWGMLHNAGFLPDFFPIHQMYYQIADEFNLHVEKLEQCLENCGVHGFNSEKDTALTQRAAECYAAKYLEKEKGWKVKEVADHDKLGYDLQGTEGCPKVFEVKGMSEPKDITLEHPHVMAAENLGANYVLVAIYNLPCAPEQIRYKELVDPQKIWRVVDRAVVSKGQWLGLSKT